MNRYSRLAIAVAGVALSCQAAAQVTVYEYEGYQGRSLTTERAINNLGRFGFNDRSSSVVVQGDRSERWEVCENPRFRGRCVILRRGEYPSLAAMGLNDRVSSVRNVGRSARDDQGRYAPPPVQTGQGGQMGQNGPGQNGQIVFYEGEGFQGRTFTAEAPLGDLRRSGFNDRASSAAVRGERWEVCDDVHYSGRCVVLRQGQYPSLAAMGLNDRISSVRTVSAASRFEDDRYAPRPVLGHDYGRRDYERIYQANITSVRAVVDNSGQRCWVDRQQATQERSGTNVPGALLGAVIGGVLGHQVGGGSGRDLATGIGVVAGAAIGGNSGRGGDQQTTARNVQRCRDTPGTMRPTYWDVTYNFRGVEHHVQMTSPPGATVPVNEQGEPRA